MCVRSSFLRFLPFPGFILALGDRRPCAGHLPNKNTTVNFRQRPASGWALVPRAAGPARRLGTEGVENVNCVGWYAF